jgi:hypothetical protein
MTIILGLTVPVAALVVGVAGVLANGGSAHAMSQSRCSANTSPDVRPARCSGPASWSG